MFTKAVVCVAFLALVAAETQKSTETSSTPVPILKQISKVNDDGSYTYGYEAGDGTFKVETRDKKGNVKGKYGYLDDIGELKVVEYTAGNGTGFSASGDHLPEPVPELPAPRPVAPQPIAPVATRQRFQPQPQPQQFQPQPQQFQPQPQQFQPQPQNTFEPQQFSQHIQRQQFQQPQNTFVPQQLPQQQFFPQPLPQQNNFVPQNAPVGNFNSFPANPQQVPQTFNNNFNPNNGVSARNPGFGFSFDAPAVSAPPLPQQFPFQQQPQAQFNNFPNQFAQQF